MITVNELRDKGFSDKEIQLILSIKPKKIMTIELVYPNIAHNEVVIGYDCVCPIIVKAEGVFIHEQSNYRFMNSNVDAFLSCLNIYAEYSKNISFYTAKDEDEIVKVVEKYIEQIKSCDFYAFSNEDFYWAIIAQQMIGGNI